MAILRKIYKYLLYLIFLPIALMAVVYSLLIYKPDLSIKTYDLFFISDYSLNIESATSNNSFLKPIFTIKNFKVLNASQEEAISIPNITFGIDVVKSILDRNINLSLLELDSFASKESGSNTTKESKSILIKGKNLKINNSDLRITSEYFEIAVSNDDLKIIFADGLINSYPYLNINVFIGDEKNKIYYSSDHFFDEASLEKNNLFDLSSFEQNKINLNLKTKGMFNYTTKQSNRFDRFNFNNSMIENKSGFKTEDIKATLFSGINRSIHGLFEAIIPDQKIHGSISYSQKEDLKIRSSIFMDMSQIIPPNQYLFPVGDESFEIIMSVGKKQTSMSLHTNFSNTLFKSSIKDLHKPKNEMLKTSIFIDDMSTTTYKIQNKKFHSFIDENNNGFFAFGASFNSNLKAENFKDGFYIFLNLKELNLDNIIYSQSDAEKESSIKRIKIKAQKFNFLNNLYTDQLIDILFNDEIVASLSGNDLNGIINIDKTNFIKINLFKTKFNFKGLDIAKSDLAKELNNINLRFIGRDIQTEDELFQDVNFYILKNRDILTIDNIIVDSQRFKIGPNGNDEKAYISFNSIKDLYKVRGAYNFDNSSGYFNDIFNYDFDILESDLNIQWNSFNALINLEGEIYFLVKDLNLNREIPESTLLRALKILNLNAIVDGSDESSGSKLFINRAAGNIILGKNRALINVPIKIETTEASMSWTGEILKNNNGELDNLNLDLAMRIKISENIPWYAAIFGGMPALAGGVVLENIFESAIEDASTINFKMQGTIKKPDLVRLN